MHTTNNVKITFRRLLVVLEQLVMFRDKLTYYFILYGFVISLVTKDGVNYDRR